MTTPSPEPGRIRRALNRVSRWRQERRETRQADSETKLGTNTLKASFALGAAQAKRMNPTLRERIGRAELSKTDLQQLAQVNVAAEFNPERYGDLARQVNQEIATRIEQSGPDIGRTRNPVRAFRRWRNVRKGTNVLKGGYAQAARDVKNLDQSIRQEAARRELNRVDLLSLAQGKVEQVIYPDGPRGPVSVPQPAQGAGQQGPGEQSPGQVAGQEASRVDRLEAALLQIETNQQALLQQQARAIAVMEAQQAIIIQQQAVIAQQLGIQQATAAQATPQTPAQNTGPAQAPAAQNTGPAVAPAAQNTGPAVAPAAQSTGPAQAPAAQNAGPAPAQTPAAAQAPAAAQNTGPAVAPAPAAQTPAAAQNAGPAQGAVPVADHTSGPPVQMQPVVARPEEPVAAQGDEGVNPTEDWMARGTGQPAPDLGQSEETPAAQTPAAGPSGQAAARTTEPAAAQQQRPLPIPANTPMSKSAADLKAESATAQSKAFDGVPVATLNTDDGKVFPAERPPTASPHRATGPAANRPHTKGGD